MSIFAIQWAFSRQIKPGTTKFVLVAMADHANENGVTFPSIASLCKKTSLNRKTVINALARLSNAGIILDTGMRKGRTNQVIVYRLIMAENETENGTVKQSLIRTGSKTGTVPALLIKSTVNTSKESQKRDTETSVKHQGNKKNNAHSLFEEWYSHYPLKKAKGQALKAFNKIKPSESLVSAMIQALEQQKSEHELKKHHEGWVPDWKYPSTWLNGRCWEDEVENHIHDRKGGRTDSLPTAPILDGVLF